MDDGRKHQRCNVHWRSAVAVTGNAGPQTLQCKTNDVSAGGVSVICPLNVFPESELIVYLLIDPGGPTHPQVVFEAQGKVMNTVLSSKQGGFRLGIQFTKFAGDSKQLLTKHLPKDLVKPQRLVTGASPAPAATAAPAGEAPGKTPVPAAAATEEGSATDEGAAALDGAATEEGAAPADSAQGEATPAAAGEAPAEAEPPGPA